MSSSNAADIRQRANYMCAQHPPGSQSSRTSKKGLQQSCTNGKSCATDAGEMKQTRGTTHMNAREPWISIGCSSSSAIADSNVWVSGPCGVMQACRDAPPGMKPPSRLASYCPEIKPMNSLITFRWLQQHVAGRRTRPC
eukprot:scaffold248293_cov15-Tisochrysis_lutea.AAC.2